MSEIDVTQQFIRELKEMGCRFALDDFGAGFSSFYYLKRFDVDYLKIDGSFIRDLATDEGNRLFVKALYDVARGLNKQVIAEWVERPEVIKHPAGHGHASTARATCSSSPLRCGTSPEQPALPSSRRTRLNDAVRGTRRML